MRARFAVCLVLVLAAAGLVAAAPVDLKPDSPAARVDGKPITVGELQRECLARFGAGTLGQMVDAMIVDQEAQKRKITVTELEITTQTGQTQAAIEAQKAQSGMGFQEWSAMRRISLREILQQSRTEILLEKMVEGNVKVSDDDVSKYYNANRDKFRQPERMLISHIAVEKQEDADRVRQDIVQGKMTFGDAARKYSIDPYSQQNGGVWGWIVRGDDPIQVAAFALKKDGDLAPVIKGKKGFEIIRRDGYQSESIPPFEDMQPKIKGAPPPRADRAPLPANAGRPPPHRERRNADRFQRPQRRRASPPGRRQSSAARHAARDRWRRCARRRRQQVAAPRHPR